MADSLADAEQTTSETTGEIAEYRRSGLFQKGNSFGGPRPGSGRKPDAVVRRCNQLLKSLTYSAAKTLQRLAESEDSDIALRAACKILDYGRGKPAESKTVNVNVRSAHLIARRLVIEEPDDYARRLARGEQPTMIEAPSVPADAPPQSMTDAAMSGVQVDPAMIDAARAAERRAAAKRPARDPERERAIIDAIERRVADEERRAAERRAKDTGGEEPQEGARGDMQTSTMPSHPIS